MEILKIMQAKGQAAFERTLSDETGPFLVIEDGGALSLAETARPGDRILAALVRDEDGWVLASSDPARPVRGGAKSAGSLPLVPGSACSVGEYVFILDSDVTVSGDILLWRVDRSPVAAESVMSGRNVVAADSLRDGAMTINPAVPGKQLFEFYPTADGLDIVMASGGRMSIARRICFAVGGFEGVLLPAAEATAALKTARPFAYPSRHIRRRLLCAVLGVVLLFLGVAAMTYRAMEVEKTADCPHGPERIPGAATDAISVYEGDDYLFVLSFFRDVPSVLGPRPTAVSRDMVTRAAKLSNAQLSARVCGFITNVVAIQESIHSERWIDLSNCLARVDRADFVVANGLRFLTDAQEVSDFANRTVPDAGLRICEAKREERLMIEASITNAITGLSDNLFISSSSLNAYCRLLHHQYDMLNAYFSVMDGIRAHPDKLDPSEVDELHARYLDILRAGDRHIPGMVDRLQADLREFTGRWIESLLAEFERKPVFRPELSAIPTLCELAENVGTDPQRMKSWRVRKQALVRQGMARARTAYEKYRLLSADRRSEAGPLLDEILTVGPIGGRFYTWAENERQRLASEEGK